MASGYSGYSANVGKEKTKASMEQKVASSTSGKASGSVDCQSDKHVPYIGVWKKFHLDMVIVRRESRKIEDYKDMSSLLSPIKMQFQLKLKFEELKKKVSAQNYRLTQCIEGLKVVVSDAEGRVTFHDIVTKLLALLEPMEEGTIVRDLPGKGRPYFISTKEIVDDLIKQEKVDVFLEGGMKTLLVGNKENVQEALDIIKSVNNQSNAGENIMKLDCPGHADVLKKLAFEEEVYQKWGNHISIRMDKNQVMIKGEKKENRDEVEKKIHRFISSLVVKDEALGELKGELFKRDAVKEYIYGRMSQENILCYLCTSDDSKVIKIFTKTNDMQQKAVKFLKQLIGELTIPRILADIDKFRMFNSLNSNKMLIHIMQDQPEHYLITATDDVISEINKMVQKFVNATTEIQQLQMQQPQMQQQQMQQLQVKQPQMQQPQMQQPQMQQPQMQQVQMQQLQMQQMPNQQKESVPYKHEVTLSPTEMNILRVFEKSFSELLLQTCGDISYQIDLNRCCIIFQSHKDICIKGRKVMKFWFDRNAYSSEVICNALVVEFYRHPAVIDHVNDHLKRNNEDCTWVVDDGGCLHILAESKHVGDRAIQRIKTAVNQVQLDNSLKKCIDTSVEMVQKMQQYGEKAQIFPGTYTEFVLVATDDVCPAIMDELDHLKSILPNTNLDRYVKEYTKVMVGKRKVQYINKIFQNEIRKLESGYNVKIFPSSDMKSLIVEGTEKNRMSAVKILKCQLSNKIQVTRVNMHQEATDRNRNSVKKIISDMGSTICQIEEDFCEPEIQFQKCWIESKGYGRRLIQVLGHAADIETEALLCPTNQSFFPLGEGLNIFLKGGKSMLGEMAADHGKDVVTKGGPEKFKEDSVFISAETGHLPCRYIVYGVVSRPPTSPEEQIPKCIEDVFRLCEEKRCNTLALSVDGSNDFECDKFSQLIVHAVIENFTKYKNLMEIYLCSNDDTLSREVQQLLLPRMLGLNCIDIDFSKLFPSSRYFVDITNDPKNVQNIGIELDTNGLGSLQVDMVVNIASPTLNLNQGAVSKSLLQAGGESIQQECTDNYPQGIKLGQAVTTTSGNLKCKKLCHGALGSWCFSGYFSMNLLKLFIINCLSEAERLGFATVGFPPLATGNLKYPCQLVASVMYDCVQEYGWRKPETCIQKVIFALHPKDHKVIEVFNAVLHGKDRVRTFEKDIAPEKKILSTWINSNGQNVHIQVLPSHCMRTKTEALVFFDSSKKSYSQATRSQDITPYWTKEGQLEIKLHKSDIAACPEILEGNRICSVQFAITDSLDQDTKAMIKEIKRAVHQYGIEKAHYIYLSHVYIVFYQQSAFRAFLDHENFKTEKFKKALKEFKAKGSTWLSWSQKSTDKEKPPKWQIVCFNEEPKEMDIDVFVTGHDKTEVEKCREQVVKAIDLKPPSPEDETVPESSEIAAQTPVFFDGSACDATNDDAQNPVVSDGSICEATKDAVQNPVVSSGSVSKATNDDAKNPVVSDGSVCKATKDAAPNPVVSDGSVCEATKDDAASSDFEFSTTEDVASGTWTSFHMTVNSMGQSLEKELTMGLQPLKMQYLLKNKLMELQKLINPKMKVEKVNREKAVISLIDENLMLEEGLVVMVECLENMSKDISTKMYPISNSEIRICITTEVTKQLASLSDAVVYDDGKSTVFLVCQTKSLQPANAIVKSVMEKRNKTKRRIGLQSNLLVNFLFNLDFKTFFKSQTGEDCTLDIKNKMLIFENASESDIVQFEAILQKFQQNTSSAKWVCPVTHGLLLKNLNAKLYIQEKIRKRNIKCFIDVGKQGAVVFYTLSAEEGKQALIVAKSSLQTILIEEKLMHIVSISKHIVGETKACITSTSNEGMLEITTTNDLAVKILTEVERITTDGGVAEMKNLESEKKPFVTDIVQYQVGEEMTVTLYNANLAYFDQTEAVVIPIYSNDNLTENSILESIFGMLNESSSKQLQLDLKSMKIGEVKISSLQEEMNWTHALFEKVSCSSKHGKVDGSFESNLKKATENGLNEAMKCGLKSIAMQLDLKVFSGMQMKTCCRAMLDGIWSSINKSTTVKKWNLDLWIVTTDPAAMQTFNKMLDTKVWSKSQNTQKDFESSQPKDPENDDKVLDEDCCICMDKITDPKWLPCKHVFCADCIDQQFTFKPACPQCGAVHGIVTGDQPPGTISRQKQHYSLPGYPECKTIAITYSFPSGYQTKEHPNPGKYYTGIERTGYLPDNKKGRLVASLLEVAFERRLVFTIGRSVTTGQEGVITWNGINHKTRTHGGPQSFGYPDETYLDRVLDELAAKGVTENSIKL